MAPAIPPFGESIYYEYSRPRGRNRAWRRRAKAVDDISYLASHRCVRATATLRRTGKLCANAAQVPPVRGIPAATNVNLPYELSTSSTVHAAQAAYRRSQEG